MTQAFYAIQFGLNPALMLLLKHLDVNAHRLVFPPYLQRVQDLQDQFQTGPDDLKYFWQRIYSLSTITPQHSPGTFRQHVNE